MGVKDLLSFMKCSLRPGSLEEFRGQSVAVDVSCWLHRGIFCCVEDLALGKETTAYLGFPLKMLRLLRSFDLHVVLVLDGQRLPAKQRTNDARRERREAARALGLSLLEKGDVEGARKALIQTTTVDHAIVRRFVAAVRGMAGVDVLMAPFEADAQLCHLAKAGIVSLVVTEDSDLVPFGCPRILFKLDESGRGTLFEDSQLYKTLVSDPANFDFAKFRRGCILAGCDYLPDGLPGVGLAKARQFFAKISHPDLRRALRRIPCYLNMNKLTVTQEFVDAFVEADNTFLYQIVFDPLRRVQRPLNDYEEGQTAADFPYAGVPLEPESRARELALGNLDPRSLERLDAFLPSPDEPWSIWSPDFRPGQPFSLPKAAKDGPARAPKQRQSISTGFQSVPTYRRAQPAKASTPSNQPRRGALAVGSVDRGLGPAGARDEVARIWGLRASASEPDLSPAKAASEGRPAKRSAALISHYFAKPKLPRMASLDERPSILRDGERDENDDEEEDEVTILEPPKPKLPPVLQMSFGVGGSLEVDTEESQESPESTSSSESSSQESRQSHEPPEEPLAPKEKPKSVFDRLAAFAAPQTAAHKMPSAAF